MNAQEPTLTQLIDWLDGRFSPEKAEEMADRVAGSGSRTAAAVHWLRGFLATASEVPLHEPPPLVRQNLNAYFDAWSTSRKITHRARVSTVVTLLFDSRRDPAPAGVRSSGSLDEVAHIGYTSGAADLLLDVTPLRAGRVRVDGQVLVRRPSAGPVFEAVLEGPDFRQRTVDGDMHGRFAFADVPDTVERLVVSNAVQSITATLSLRGDST